MAADSSMPRKDMQQLSMALHVLSAYLGVPVKLMYSDAPARVQRAIGTPAADRLRHYLKRGHAARVLEPIGRDEFSRDLLKKKDIDVLDSLCPLPEEPFGDPPRECKHLEQTISQSLWCRAPIFSNPYHSQLKDHFPRLRQLCRLHHLNWVEGWLQGRRPDTLQRCPSGLIEAIQPVQWGGQHYFVVVGLVWSREILENHHPHCALDVAIERHFRLTVENLRKLCPKGPLSNEEMSHLLRLTRVYSPTSPDELEGYAIIAGRVLANLFSLPADYRSGLQGEQWHELVGWRLFCELPDTKDRVADLHAPTPPNRIILALRGHKPASIVVQQEMLAPPGPARKVMTRWTMGAQETIMVDCSPDLGGSAQVTDLHPRLRDAFTDFHAIGHTREQFHERVFLERIEFHLRHLPYDDIPAHTNQFAERAAILAAAESVIYLDYDAVKAELIPGSSVSNPLFHAGSELIAAETAAQELKTTFAKWAGDSVARAGNHAYRCMDSLQPVSRFDDLIQTAVAPEDTAAADGRNQYLDLPSSTSHPSFPGERDSISMPVTYYGRRQGVLHLSSNTKDHFRYANRLRLLGLVNLFEPELFEARLTDTIRRMNLDLTKAVHGDLTGMELYDSLAAHAARLFAAQGAALWWGTSAPGNRFTLLGRETNVPPGMVTEMSADRKGFLTKLLATADVVVIGEFSGGDSVGGVTDSHGCGAGIAVPIVRLDSSNNVVGFLCLLDRSRPQEPPNPPLRQAMVFVASEISQIVRHYHVYQWSVVGTRNMVSHDVNAALRQIDGAQGRLSQYAGLLPKDRRRDFLKGMDDIRKCIAASRNLLDYLTGQGGDLDSDIARISPMAAYTYHLRRASPLKKRLDIYPLLQSVLHTRLRDLHKRAIYYRVGDVSRSIWLHEQFLEQVFSNLVDNVVKYGKPNSELSVYGEDTPSRWRLVFESSGQRLPRDAMDSPERVFSEGYQGVENKKRGEGLGMYNASQLARAWSGSLELDYTHPRGDEEWGHYKFSLYFPRWLESEENPWDNWLES